MRGKCGQLPVKTDRSGGIQTGDGACHCTLQTEKAGKEQKENLLVADKKLLLYRLFNTKESVTEIVEKLKEYKINLENKYICFVSIETRNNYFELCEEEFEKILKRNMKLPYEQIDFYPNQIYVIIYSREPIEERKVENSIRFYMPI